MTTAAHFWDKAADKYAKSKIADPDDYERTLDRMRHHLGATDQVLEVGAGTGSTALLLAPHVARVTATDLSTRMMEIGADKAKAAGVENVSFVAADVTDPALGGPSYDAVLALNLLHLVPDLPASLSRIHGVLAPGGLLISKTPTLASGAWWFRIFLGLALPLMQAIGKAPFVARLTHDSLEGQIKAAGFQIIEASTSPNVTATRFLVAQKVG